MVVFNEFWREANALAKEEFAPEGWNGRNDLKPVGRLINFGTPEGVFFNDNPIATKFRLELVGILRLFDQEELV